MNIPARSIPREQMDALVDAHYRAEELADFEAIDHVVDEAVLAATAVGRPFGLEGRGRPVRARILHVFEFAEGLISRESAWLDVGAIQEQLS
jgi:predicted ester cyclase